MKRIIVSIITCILLGSLTACEEPTPPEKIISNHLGVSVGDGIIETYTDNHGGFHGDGEAYAKVSFSDDSFYDLIRENPEWHNLPLPQTLKVIVYGGKLDSGESWAPFIEDKYGCPLLPDVYNGYYFFKDRHRESTDEKDSSIIFDRYSMNFTMAIYDSDTKTLYFYGIDT